MKHFCYCVIASDVHKYVLELYLHLIKWLRRSPLERNSMISITYKWYGICVMEVLSHVMLWNPITLFGLSMTPYSLTTYGWLNCPIMAASLSSLYLFSSSWLWRDLIATWIGPWGEPTHSPLWTIPNSPFPSSSSRVMLSGCSSKECVLFWHIWALIPLRVAAGTQYWFSSSTFALWSSAYCCIGNVACSKYKSPCCNDWVHVHVHCRLPYLHADVKSVVALLCFW